MNMLFYRLHETEQLAFHDAVLIITFIGIRVLQSIYT